MKGTKLFFAMLLAHLVTVSLKAQTPFATNENLDINLFKVSHLVHGDMWYDESTYLPAFEYPKTTGKHASYLATIWMHGKDNSGNLYLSAQRYRSVGVDYWPGPLDASGSLSLTISTDWAKIWKVDATTIADFNALYSGTGAAAITASKFNVIKEWPAKGNIYAKGNTGAALSIVYEMAPFIDINGDGVYNWMDGDYPKIKGDQMLWWVFSDNGPTHTSSKGMPLRVEYHAMAYGYKRGTDVDRIIFYEFIMHNKSTIKYNDFRFGLFSDADLGGPFDDYIAFDSVHRMGIEYNAGIPDEPAPYSYGAHPPLTGLSFIEMPGDNYPSSMLPAGTFNYFDNAFSGLYRDPRIDTEYYHIMNARGADGTPRYYGNYAYPISKGAVMCDSTFPLGDRRYVITSSNYAFQPGTKAKIAMAFMATDTTGNACPGVNFKPLTDLADTAWKVYYNPLPALSIVERNFAQRLFKIYPNPAQTTLLVDVLNSPGNEATLRIIDAFGKTIEVPLWRNALQYKINISALAAGVYSVLYFDGGQIVSQHFVKQ